MPLRLSCPAGQEEWEWVRVRDRERQVISPPRPPSPPKSFSPIDTLDCQISPREVIVIAFDEVWYSRKRRTRSCMSFLLLSVLFTRSIVD